MKNKFISIGMNSFIPINGIKYILDSEARISKRIIDEVKASENYETGRKIFNCVPRASKRLTIILMNNNDIYYSRLRPNTIAERATLTGLELIKVGTGLYLSVYNIKGVFGFETTVATNVRGESEETKIANNISLVRKTKKRKSTIVLKDGTSVSVALTPRKLLENFIASKEEDD